MFTGIVAAVGEIRSVEALGQGAGARVSIGAGTLDLSDVAVGDSIAVQGACMTVVGLDDGAFAVDVSRESLDHTVGLDRRGPVNLEKALRLADRLGGHLVTGHVDATATVARMDPVAESWALDVLVPRALGRYFAYKGSATIDGVSLTVNRVDDRPDGTLISMNLIPHTVAVTTLNRLQAGDRVNLEVDLVARYLERLHGDPSPKEPR